MPLCECFGLCAELVKYDEETDEVWIQCTKCGRYYAVRGKNMTPGDPPWEGRDGSEDPNERAKACYNGDLTSEG